MGGDDFNKSNTNGRNTGKSIDELKRIVYEKRNSEIIERAEQVNAMFERILETGDIENKIMEKMSYIFDNSSKMPGQYQRNSLQQRIDAIEPAYTRISYFLPFVWSGAQRRHFTPISRYTPRLAVDSSMLSHEQLEWFELRISSKYGEPGIIFNIEKINANNRFKIYNAICFRLQEHFEGIKCGLEEKKAENKLVLTVSW